MYQPVTANSEISPISRYEEVRIISFYNIKVKRNVYMIFTYYWILTILNVILYVY